MLFGSLILADRRFLCLGETGLVAWLDLVILKWELRRQTRRLGIKFKDLRVSDVQEFLDEIGITEEQFKSIRKDIRPETRLGQAGGRNTKC